MKQKRRMPRLQSIEVQVCLRALLIGGVPFEVVIRGSGNCMAVTGELVGDCVGSQKTNVEWKLKNI